VITATIHAMRERGEVISSLMPATTRLYRRLGWEIAGVHGAQTVAARDLGLLSVGDTVAVRRGSVADLPAAQACYDAVAPGRDGMLDRPGWWWERTVSSRFPGMALTVVDGEDGDGTVDGYAVWERTPPPPGDEGHGITVHEVISRRPDAALALWRLFGGTASQVREVSYFAPPEDPLLLLLPEQTPRPSWHLRWMLRVVDLPGAIAARGWRAGITVDVDLDVRDRHAPWNDGRWRLHVADGHATVEKGGTGTVQVGIAALASLYSGYASATSLARLGLLSGASARELGALDALLAGPTPWLQDFF
jgi:predicted acetyltransferase